MISLLLFSLFLTTIVLFVVHHALRAIPKASIAGHGIPLKFNLAQTGLKPAGRGMKSCIQSYHWQSLEVDGINSAEVILDQLEDQGIHEREVHLIGASRCLIRWR